MAPAINIYILVVHDIDLMFSALWKSPVQVSPAHRKIHCRFGQKLPASLQNAKMAFLCIIMLYFDEVVALLEALFVAPMYPLRSNTLVLLITVLGAPPAPLPFPSGSLRAALDLSFDAG